MVYPLCPIGIPPPPQPIFLQKIELAPLPVFQQCAFVNERADLRVLACPTYYLN